VENLDEATIGLRLLLAGILAAVLGIERELKGHLAGLRTHILVSLGACLFTLAGMAGFQGVEPSAMTRADITRVASQVVVGIGFLGGGAILRHQNRVVGLTTAANLWIAAAVGLAVAAGFYFGAVVTTALVLFVLAGLKRAERRLTKRRRARRTIDGELNA
jgi:putative Mg2+ transporter-C (MgtC) family protein